MLNEFDRAIRDNQFVQAVLEARDMLRPIISGEITRGHCLAGKPECYGGRPGKRKTKLADAVRIAKTVEVILNRAIDEFDKADPSHEL